MSADIVSLRGDEIPMNGIAQGCVDILRKLLERAERGEIHSVAVIAVRSNETVCSNWWRSSGHTHALIAGIEYLKMDMHASCPSDKED